MRTTVFSFLLGWLLCAVLMLLMPFLYAWIVVAIFAISVEAIRIRKFSVLGDSIGFWIIFGSLVPIYFFVLNMF